VSAPSTRLSGYLSCRLVVLRRPFNSYHSWSFGRAANFNPECLYQYRSATPEELDRDLRVQARILRNHNVILGHPSQFTDMRHSGYPRVRMDEILGRPHYTYGGYWAPALRCLCLYVWCSTVLSEFTCSSSICVSLHICAMRVFSCHDICVAGCPFPAVHLLHYWDPIRWRPHDFRSMLYFPF